MPTLSHKEIRHEVRGWEMPMQGGGGVLINQQHPEKEVLNMGDLFTEQREVWANAVGGANCEQNLAG